MGENIYFRTIREHLSWKRMVNNQAVKRQGKLTCDTFYHGKDIEEGGKH